MLDYSIFRAYDIRGTYPDQLNEGSVYRIARNMYKLFPKGSTFIIGHDARDSAPILYHVLELGLRVAGMRVVRAGMISTPMLSFLVQDESADGGIIVTASHSSAEYNGLKFMTADSTAVGGKEILSSIGKRALSAPIHMDHILDLSPTKPDRDAIGEYVTFLLSHVHVSRPVRIVADASNGVVGPLLERLVARVSPDVACWHLLNIVPDGTFPAHGPDPTHEASWEQAREVLLREHADIAVIFDGDGDRAVFLDEKGDMVWPEYVWRLLATATKVDDVVHDATTGYLTRQLLENMEDEYHYPVRSHSAKVGHLYMTKEMHTTKASIGFEYSGHYYFKELGGVSSGMMTMLRVMNALSALPYTFSEFCSFLPSSVRLDDVAIEGITNPRRVLNNVRKTFGKRIDSISTKDGLSFWNDGVWCNIRPSNTSDVVRVTVEGTSKSKVNALKREVLSLLKKHT
jgi:phosphomannomutase